MWLANASPRFRACSRGEALITNDKAGIVKAKGIIFAKEHEADAIKDGLGAHLPKSRPAPAARAVGLPIPVSIGAIRNP